MAVTRFVSLQGRAATTRVPPRPTKLLRGTTGMAVAQSKDPASHWSALLLTPELSVRPVSMLKKKFDGLLTLLSALCDQPMRSYSNS